nr:uncharacterized protein LOC115266334 [Aedes albopictus]
MDLPNLISFMIIGLFCAGICARPGQLKEEKYEFQEFYSSSSQGDLESSSHNARLQVSPIQYEVVTWSQQHPNEVSAFAEMFRQNYNRMVFQYNEMMQLHQQTMANIFTPVTYELYHVPVGYTWDSYFGNTLPFVYYETERMSRQLIEDLEQGRRSPEELLNPNFFIEQAANELNMVHQSHQQIDSSNGVHNFDSSQGIHNFDNSYQRPEQAFLIEQETNQHDFLSFGDSFTKDEQVSSTTKRPSYVQSLPPVRFDNEKVKTNHQQIEQIEVHTPISVELSRQVQTVTPTNQPSQANNDKFYGSTYDQQPKFDLQFVESQSSSVTSSRDHVMSLVRNRSKVKDISTNPTTTTIATTTTTTPLPTTTSSIMSMLPNKQPARNYTDLYQQVRAELEKHLKQESDNKTEETHFMGMTSNTDHVKLTYETVNHRKNEKETRGDQGITTDDYVYEDTNEPEPIIGYNPTTTEPASLPRTSKIPITTNPFYSVALAPFPTTTTLKPSNPYYSAPLAPFPGEMFRESSENQQLQYAEYSEVLDMNQEVQTIEHHYGGHVVEADTIQDMNNHEEFNQGQFQIHQGYDDMQQYEDLQQRYTDIGGSVDIGQALQHQVEHRLEKQSPPEQAYRNPDLQHTSVKNVHQEDGVPAHVQEVTVTPISVDIPTQKKNWFQRQFDKMKNVLHV